MNNIRKIWRVFILQLHTELFCWRNMLVFAVMAVFISSNLEPIAAMVNALGIKATPTGFVHLMNDHTCLTILTIGIIFLYSNAPFRRESFSYIVYRSGKKNWEIGNVVYMCISSLMYTSFLFVVSVLSLIRETEFSLDGWGKIWGTLARTTASTEFNVKVVVNDYILGKYEPMEALVATFVLIWLCFFFFGLLIYLFNHFFKKGLGVILAGIFVFLDTMIYNSWTPWAYRFSPLTLVQLTTYTNYHKHYGLTLSYAWIFFGVSILIMIFGIVLLSMRREQSYE